MSWIYYVSNTAGSMSLADMQNNALEIYGQLNSYGWTLDSISAVLGNIQRESFINPAQWQIGYPIGTKKGGYGLVQWTPSTNYTRWANENSKEITSGFWQVYCIDTEANGRQWIPTSDFPLSYTEFKTSEEAIPYLVEAFLKNYERAGVRALQERIDNANYWYQYLSGEEPPTPNPPPAKKPNKMPIWMMCRKL